MDYSLEQILYDIGDSVPKIHLETSSPAYSPFPIRANDSINKEDISPMPYPLKNDTPLSNSLRRLKKDDTQLDTPNISLSFPDNRDQNETKNIYGSDTPVQQLSIKIQIDSKGNSNVNDSGEKGGSDSKNASLDSQGFLKSSIKTKNQMDRQASNASLKISNCSSDKKAVKFENDKDNSHKNKSVKRLPRTQPLDEFMLKIAKNIMNAKKKKKLKSISEKQNANKSFNTVRDISPQKNPALAESSNHLQSKSGPSTPKKCSAGTSILGLNDVKPKSIIGSVIRKMSNKNIPPMTPVRKSGNNKTIGGGVGGPDERMEDKKNVEAQLPPVSGGNTEKRVSGEIRMVGGNPMKMITRQLPDGTLQRVLIKLQEKKPTGQAMPNESRKDVKKDGGGGGK